MATPYILDLLANLKTRVATNETNISKNTADIKKNRQDFDTHTADDTRHWTTADRTNFNRVIHFKGYYTSIDALKKAYATGTVGDYAIVENTNGYDLIKVVGVVVTKEDLVDKFSKTKYERMKETKGKVEIQGNKNVLR